MSKTLKLEISVADLGQNGVIVSEFATTEYVANELSKKATLNAEGKVDPSLLPDYTYVDGLVDKLEDVEQSYSDADAEVLQTAKNYSDSKITENNSKKADLVEGKIPYSQLPYSLNLETNLANEFVAVRDEIKQTSDGLVSQIATLDTDLTAYVDSKDTERKDYIDRALFTFLEDLDLRYNEASTRLQGEVDAVVAASQTKVDAEVLKLKKGETVKFDQAISDAIGGYPLHARIGLDNGDIVKSTVAANTVNPNVDMTGWKFPSHGSLSDRDMAGSHPASAIADASGKTQQELNSNLSFKYSYASNAIYQELRFKLSESVSVKDFGAIGDGTLHTLQEWVDSGKFSSLLAIQVVYPFITSLDQSIDYAAIQKAINVSNNATGDNPLVVNTNYTKAFRIRVPCGKYMLSDELDLRRRNYITLFGDDRMRSILTYAGSDTTKSVVNASNFADSMIENITLDANKVAKYNLLHSFDESLTGVSIKNKFRDLHLINNTSATGVALYVGSASTRQISESSFSNILFEDCWRCIELDGNQVLNVSFEHLYNFTTSENTPYPDEMEQKDKFFIHVRNGQMNSFSKIWPNCAKGCVALRVTPSQHSVRVKLSDVYTEIDRPFLWLDDESTKLWVTEIQVDDINLGWFKSGTDGEFIHNGHAAFIQANNFYIRENGSGGFTQNFTGGYASVGSTLSLRDSFRLIGFSPSDYVIDYSTAQSVTTHFGRSQGLHLWNNSQDSTDKSALKLYRKQQFGSSRSGIEFRSYDGFSDGHIKHTTSDQYSFSVYDANDIELMRFKPKFVGIVGASGATGYDKPLYYGSYATWVDADGKLRKHSVKPTANNQGKTVDSDQAEDTAANIASIAATINTTNKFNGKLVWDTTNNRMMRASGGAAASVWWVIDGSSSVTPI